MSAPFRRLSGRTEGARLTVRIWPPARPHPELAMRFRAQLQAPNPRAREWQWKSSWRPPGGIVADGDDPAEGRSYCENRKSTTVNRAQPDPISEYARDQARCIGPGD